jgi:internalin A
MKQILVMMAAVVLVAGCGTTKVDPNAPANITDPIVEERVRRVLKKPTGKLTNADLAKVTRLTYLYRTRITDEGLKEVAKLQNLTELDLWDTKITDAGLKDVAKLQKLAYLNLGYTQITAEGLKEVAKLQELTRLELAGTQITDAGLNEIAKLQKLKRLELYDTKITKTGVAELKKALPNCRISGS